MKKIPDGEMLDTKTKTTSGGKQMLYGNYNGLSDDIKEKYKKENLNEREKI